MQVYSIVNGGAGGASGAAGGSAGKGFDITIVKASAQANIITIMVISTIFLAIAAYFFLSNNPQQERTYVMLMIHASIFISTISASIAIMQQLNAI
jgi:heme/copper-type cytochrome/quinol oxidase subunit 4